MQTAKYCLMLIQKNGKEQSVTLSRSSQKPYSPFPPTTKFLFCSLEPIFSSKEIPFTPRQSTPCVTWEQFQPLPVLPPGFLMIRTRRAAWKKSIHYGEKTCTCIHFLLLVLSATYGNYHCVPASIQALSMIYICSSLEHLTWLLLFLISAWGHWS